MEQIFLEAVLRHMEEKEVMWDNQHGFTKGRSCLTYLSSFYVGITVSVDKGRTTDDVCQDFSEAFDSVPHNILLSRVERYGFGGWMDEEPKEWWSMAQCPLPEVSGQHGAAFYLRDPQLFSLVSRAA